MKDVSKKIFCQFRNGLAYRFNASWSRPSLIYLKITENCNFRCQHCDMWKTTATDLNMEKWQTVVENLKGLAIKPAITISGGEPLLNVNFWPLIDLLKQSGFRISLNTNGSLITKEVAERLVKSGLEKIEVSLYTLRPYIHDVLRGFKGAFERARQAIDLLLVEKNKIKDSQTKVMVAFLLTKENSDEIEEFIRYFSALGVWISIQSLDANIQSLKAGDSWLTYQDPASNPLWIRDMAEVNNIFRAVKKLKREGFLIYNSLAQLDKMRQYYLGDFATIKKLSCLCGHNNLIINSRGEVFFCFRGPSIGDLSQDSALKIWRSKRALEVRHQIRSCPQLCRVMNYNFKTKIVRKIIEKVCDR